MVWCVVSAHDMDEKKKVTEIILIEESPLPTRNDSSPRASPPLSRRARRGGRRRFRSHVRSCTLSFNPGLPHHCGFQAVLRAAGRAADLPSVMNLRDRVVEEIVRARLQGEQIANVDVHDMLRAEGMSLQAYAASMRHNMWASKVEIAAAAHLLGIAVAYKMGKNMETLGDGKPSYCIILKNEHFKLAKLHKKISVRYCHEEEGEAYVRAGMEEWSAWQHESHAHEHDEIPTWALEPQPMEQPTSSPHALPTQPPRESSSLPSRPTVPTYQKGHCVTVQNMDGVDLHSLIFAQSYMGVAAMKKRLSSILQKKEGSFVVASEQRPLHDWEALPYHVFVRNVSSSPYVKLTVVLPERDTSFILHVDHDASYGFVEAYVAKVLGVMPHFVLLKNEDGTPWVPMRICADHEVYVHVTGYRGGMRSQRTVSSTEPFQETQQQDQEIVQPMEHVGARASRSRSPPSSMSSSPETSLRQGDASPTRHSWYANASPPDLPHAQNEPYAVPVIEGEHLPIGYVWADPTCIASEVLSSIRRDMPVDVHVTCEPEEHLAWSSIRRVTFGPRPVLDEQRTVDLRVDRWELYQEPRTVPFLSHGAVPYFFVIPSRLSLERFQSRLNTWAPPRDMYIVSAVDAENWVVYKKKPKESLLRCLALYDEFRLHMAERVERGGMERLVNREVQTHEGGRGPWDRGEYAIVWVVLAHTPQDNIYPFVARRVAMVYNLHEAIAGYFMQRYDWIRLSSFNYPLMPTQLIRDIIDSPVVVHMRAHEMRPGYRCLYTIQWPGSETDTLDLEDEPMDPNVHLTLQVAPAVRIPEVEVDVDEVHLPRGGARTARLNPTDPRTAMITWALQKIMKEVPHMNTSTANMLLRAENCTVTAVLNARSTSQLVEVLDAALRRVRLAAYGHSKRITASSSSRATSGSAASAAT